MLALVTVVITTYGETTYLPRAIRSILSQTHENWELLVVDDNGINSPYHDEVKYILNSEEFSDSRINLIAHERNMNGSAARNTGIAQASGDAIAFLDDDDEYDSLRLEKCLNFLNENTNFKGVYTRTKYIRSNGRVDYSSRGKSGNYYIETLACRYEFGTGSNIFFDRQIFEDIGLFDTSLRRHQDYDILVRFFEYSDIGYLDDILVTKYMEYRNIPGFVNGVTIKLIYLKKYLIHSKRLDIQSVIYILMCNIIDSLKLLIYSIRSIK